VEHLLQSYVSEGKYDVMTRGILPAGVNE